MIASATPSTMSVPPMNIQRRSRPAFGSFSRMSATSARNRATRSSPRGSRRRSGLGVLLRLTHDLPTVPTCRWTCSEPGRSWRRHCPDTRRQLLGEVGGRADRGDLAVHHDHGLVGDAQDRLRELLDDEDGHAFARDVRDDLVQLFDDDRRQPHRQLVEEEQRGVGGEPAGHRQHLLFAARQRAGELAAPFGETREARVRDLLDLVQGAARERAHAEVLAHGQVREDALALGHEAEARAGELVRTRAVDAPARDEQVAGGRRHQTRTRPSASSTSRRRSGRGSRAPCPRGRRGRRRAPLRCGRTRP